MTKGSNSRRPVLGVFGGAFDPPHLAHVLTVPYVVARGLCERVLVAPCFEHPFGKPMTGFARRLGWTRAAMEGHGGAAEVSDVERRLARSHGGPSHTLRLLEEVERGHPDHEVRLVVGSDVTAGGETDRWHRWGQIVARYDPVVVPRVGHAPEADHALPDVSSTRVRELLAGPRSEAAVAELRTMVPAAVLDMVLSPRSGRLWIVGRGNVATHAEPWLAARGYDVDVIGTRALLDGEPPPEGAPPRGVWILSRDPDVEAVAARLVGAVDPAVPVLHGGGARPASSALAALRAAGHPVGTLHPICSLRRERAASLLSRASFGIEGDPQARTLAEELCAPQPWLDLQSLDATGRTAYHAACALAANHLAVLEADAARVLVAQGHAPAKVNAALAVLLRSSLENLLDLGIPAGVTGPVSRGDTTTVDAHLASLDPETAALYRTLSERLSAVLAGGR